MSPDRPDPLAGIRLQFVRAKSRMAFAPDALRYANGVTVALAALFLNPDNTAHWRDLLTNVIRLQRELGYAA